MKALSQMPGKIFGQWISFGKDVRKVGGGHESFNQLFAGYSFLLAQVVNAFFNTVQAP